MYLNEMIVLDLLSLESITLGYCTLCGKEDNPCSLIMRSRIEVIRDD